MEDGISCGDFSCFSGSDVVLLILANLELHDLFQMRCVCRSWRSAIASPQFIDLWKWQDRVCVLNRQRHSQSTEVWYPRENRRRKSGLCPDEPNEIWRSWRSAIASPQFIDLWKWQDRVCVLMRILNRQRHSQSTEVWYPHENRRRRSGLCPNKIWRFSSHGLVLVCELPEYDDDYDDDDYTVTLVVGNPITNVWRKLPHLEDQNGLEHFFIKADPATGNYKVGVMFFHEESPGYTMKVMQYDSAKKTWESSCKFDSKIDEKRGEINGSVVRIEPLDVNGFLVAYDPDTMGWSSKFAGQPESRNEEDEIWKGCRLHLGDVFSYQGRIILTTTAVKTFDDHRREEELGIVVWELDDESSESWKILSRRTYRELYGLECEEVFIFKHKTELVGDLLVFSSFVEIDSRVPVAFDLTTRSWSSPFSSFYGKLNYECGTFVPNFCIMP